MASRATRADASLPVPAPLAHAPAPLPLPWVAPVSSETLLLPSTRGHVACGTAPPRVGDALIEGFLAQVNHCYRWSLDKVRESGFLVYPTVGEERMVAEAVAYGRRYRIEWHWRYRQSTVAASFHTHPNRLSTPTPSGLDMLGALVRGDHLHYILTMDGRLVGWRFREPRKDPRAVDEALRILSEARALTPDLLDFLERAFVALAREMMTPVYGARLTLLPEGGIHLERADPRELVGSDWR